MNAFKYEKTKGLWVWGKSINLENGNKLLIFDSQGFNKNDKDSISHKIYILSILIIYKQSKISTKGKSL